MSSDHPHLIFSQDSDTDSQVGDFMPEFYDFHPNSNFSVPSVQLIATPEYNSYLNTQHHSALQSETSSVLSDNFLRLNEIQDDVDSDLSEGSLHDDDDIPAQSLDYCNSTKQHHLSDSLPGYFLQPSPVVNTMEKLANCRKFGGYPHENASVFLSEFESYATLHNISPLEDHRKIAALHFHLSGPALTWFNILHSDTKS